MKRRTFAQYAGMAGTLMMLAPLMLHSASSANESFPLMDLHVHLTPEFTIEQAMELAAKRNVKFGIVEHPAV